MNCVFCDSVVETLDHCFFKCSCIDKVWRKFWSWWNQSALRPSNIDSVKSIIHSALDPKFPRSEFTASCAAALWMIWKWRNRILFAGSSEVDRIKVDDIFPHIQKMVAMWVKNRKPNTRLDLDKWCINPLEALGAG